MSKKNSDGVKVKYFFLGIIITLAIGGIAFGIYKFINSTKTNNSSSDNIVIDGIEYVENVTDSKYSCDAFKDAWVWEAHDFLVTNSGDLYQINTSKKFSDTKQNCKKIDNIKIRAVINNLLVDENGKKYTVNYDDSNNPVIAETNEDYQQAIFKSPVFNDEVKYAFSITGDEENQNYLVLKNDGKIYKYILKREYDDSMMQDRYELVNQELFYEIEGEKIVLMRPDYEFSILNYIKTDKAYYIAEIINKECEEYADIKCEYKYTKNKRFK